MLAHGLARLRRFARRCAATVRARVGRWTTPRPRSLAAGLATDLVRPLFWRRKSAPRTRPSPLATATIALIEEMGRDNPLWGAERIRGELLKLDIRASKRTIFTEQLPTLATRYARKTTRVVAVRTPLAFALGGEGGTRLVTVLGMVASAATLLRLIRRTPVPTRSRLPRIGIDDFALQRGRRYGTIIIDLDTHQPVEVLADRRAETVATWLRAHPEVETIARDRGGAYAEGARQGAPAATQVADRWHLLKHLGDALEQVVSQHGAAIRAAAHPDPAAPSDAVLTAAPGADDQLAPAVVVPVAVPTVALPVADIAPRADGDVRQQERFAAIHALHEAGATVSAIARELGLTRLTVRKYLRASAAPERVRRQGLLGATSLYVAHLRTRWGDGCDNAAVLWAELRAMGFPGSAGVVRRFLGHWRTTPRRPGRQPQATGTVGVVPPVAPPTVRDVRWWLLTAPDQRRPEQHVYLTRLETAVPTLQLAGALAREFGRLVRQRDGAALDAWLGQAETSGLKAFASCAKSLRHDYAAVAAALRESSSNGPTEGNVTRIKLLKRQMYGRAKLDLLRQRVLYQAN